MRLLGAVCGAVSTTSLFFSAASLTFFACSLKRSIFSSWIFFSIWARYCLYMDSGGPGENGVVGSSFWFFLFSRPIFVQWIVDFGLALASWFKLFRTFVGCISYGLDTTVTTSLMFDFLVACGFLGSYGFTAVDWTLVAGFLFSLTSGWLCTADTTAVFCELWEFIVELVVQFVVVAWVNLEVVTEAYLVLSGAWAFFTFCEFDLSSFFFAYASFAFSNELLWSRFFGSLDSGFSGLTSTVNFLLSLSALGDLRFAYVLF